MANTFIVIIFCAVGLLHLYPALGVISGDRLHSLYGLTFDEPNLLILMRHRAVLFGLLGAFLIGAAFCPGWRSAGYAAGFIAMLSFVLLAHSQGSVSPELRKVVIADIAGSMALALAGLIQLIATHPQN